MGKLMVVVTRFLPLCVVFLVLSAVATAQPIPPEITRVETFREGVLVFFRVFFTDPNNDAEGFGFRWFPGSEEHPFSSPSFGRVSPGKVEYPFNLGCGTGSEIVSGVDVEVWIYDSAGLISPSVTVHLACNPPTPPPPPPPQECLPSPSGDTCARIDFNALLDGAPTSDPGLSFVAVDGLYSPLGVNFRSKDDAGPTFSHPLHPNSSQSIVINDVSRPQGGTFNIVAEFLTPTNFVSADVLSEAGRSVRMTAKDASGAILGSTTSSSATISAFPFKGNVALSGIGAISTVEFEAVPDPAVAVVAIDNLTFSVVFEAAPVSQASSAPVPIPCQGKSCRVAIFCISADLAVPCNNAISVSVRRARRSSVAETSGEVSDGRRAKAPLMVPFASGAANIPPRQVASVKLKVTKQGRRIAQSRVKKLRGVMSINNIAGSRTLSVPVRIKLK